MATKSKTKNQLPIIECATCQTPYVIRLGFTFPSAEQVYRFQCDCRHKTAAAVLLHDPEGNAVTAPGPLQ